MRSTSSTTRRRSAASSGSTSVSLFFTFCAIVWRCCWRSARSWCFRWCWRAFGCRSFDAPVIGLLRWPVLFMLVIVGLSMLYRYGPSRRRRAVALAQRRQRVRRRWRGSRVSSLFSWYLANFANYNATYGSLGAVVGLMMWMWLSTIVDPGRRRAQFRDRASDRDGFHRRAAPKPLGARGAVMADTVGTRT